MDFPVYITLGPLQIHPHFLFEALSYFIGFQLYRMMRSPERLPAMYVVWIVTGTIVGAAIGSKVLYWFENPQLTWQNWNNLVYLLEGKTIVGGLLGGWIGVEVAKKYLGWKRSTGDDFVIPLIVGMSIGRVGCFLTGLDDHTYGVATTWWTGIDFGDGVLRHPTQLYEIAFLAALLAFLLILKATYRKQGQGQEATAQAVSWFMHNGMMFRLFLFSYLAFRLMIDFIKPTLHPFWGLNNVQVACVLGMLFILWEFMQRNIRKKEVSYAQ